MDAHYRQSLAQYFRDLAIWHEQSFDSGDSHVLVDHLPQVGFFNRLAAHINSLADDDVRIVALARLTDLDHQVVFSPGPRVSAALGEVGKLVDVHPDAFLDHLVHAALDDELDLSHHATTLLVPELEASPSAAG